MVRNEGRLGLAEVTAYLNELHRAYPGGWVTSSAHSSVLVR